MSKKNSDEQVFVELIWLEFFQSLKLNDPKSLAVFFKILMDFTAEHPNTAGYLTVETLHGILLEEI